jgi:hypothetical protein
MPSAINKHAPRQISAIHVLCDHGGDLWQTQGADDFQHVEWRVLVMRGVARRELHQAVNSCPEKVRRGFLCDCCKPPASSTRSRPISQGIQIPRFIALEDGISLATSKGVDSLDQQSLVEMERAFGGH